MHGPDDNKKPARRLWPATWFSAGREAPHIARGHRGEDIAARFLRNKGYRILRRNFRPKQGGEIDIVARDREVLVFIEVKAREDDAFGRPASAVDRRKRRRIAAGAMAWLRMLDMPDIAFRFDIVEVVDDSEVEHIENAFNLPAPLHY